MTAYELLVAWEKRAKGLLGQQRAAIAVLEDAVRFHPECEHCVQALATLEKVKDEAKRLQ